MERSFYFPLTLGVRSSKPSRRARTRQTAFSPGREREYEPWSESVFRQEFSYARFPEAQVLSGLTQDVAPGSKVWVVLGEPGAGKSTLFTEWFCRWASELELSRIGMAVPVLVCLRELSSAVFTLDSDSLADRLWRAGLEARARLDPESASLYAPEALHRLTPIWLLDGLDEIDRQFLTAGFFARLVNLPGAKALSCRTALFEDWRDAAMHYQAREYEILALQPDEQATFLRCVMADDSSAADTLYFALQCNPQLRRLAGSPLLLRLIADVCEPGELPLTRTGFYSDAVTSIWHRNLIHHLPIAEYDRVTTFRDDVLSALAGALGLEKLNETLRFLVQVARDFCHESTGRVVECLDRSGILEVDRSRDSFGFLHLTFHEYFLARSLQSDGLAAAFERYWIEPKYEETLALLITLLLNLGEQAEVEAAICGFIGAWQTAHSNAPVATWEIGRSPLRVALHVLARAGVDVAVRESRLERELVDTIGISLERKLAVAGDHRMPGWLLETLANDPDDEVRSRVAENQARSAEGEQLNQNPGAKSTGSGEDEDVREANNNGTSPERLAGLAEHPNKDVRSGVAGNPNTRRELLSRLSTDADENVRKRVAGNPNAPPYLLFELAENYPEARLSIAGNPSAPYDLISRLATDRDYAVRGQVARALVVFPEILGVLANDEEGFVREGVAENPRAAEEILVQLAVDEMVEIRRKVAANPSTPARTLAELLGDREVRSDVLRNPNILLEDL